MKTLKQYKDEHMKDITFAKEYEAMQPEMDVIRAIVEEHHRILHRKSLRSVLVLIRLILASLRMVLEILL